MVVDVGDGVLEEAMEGEMVLERIRVVPLSERMIRRMWLSFWGRLAMVKGFSRR